jgi:5-enolpyruvylshikimate-3-phosphate synthase
LIYINRGVFSGIRLRLRVHAMASCRDEVSHPLARESARGANPAEDAAKQSQIVIGNAATNVRQTKAATPPCREASSLLKFDSSHRRRPVSRERESIESTHYWMPVFTGMTE